MIKIAVCDDELKTCREVERLLLEMQGLFGEPIAIDIYTNGKKLLDSGIRYDLFFLDVIMPDINGISMGEGLLKRYSDPIIVYVSSSLDAAVDSYKVEASGFVLKPVDPMKFKATLSRVILKRFNHLGKTITLTYKGVDITIAVDDILYAESKLHKMTIKMRDKEDIEFYEKLSTLETALETYSQFVRIHQSFLVNLNYVDKLLKSEVLLNSGEMLPVSRNKEGEVREKYYKFRLE